MNTFPWKRALHSRSVWFSLLVIACFGLVSLLAPWLAPHNPYREGYGQSDLPPMWVQDAPEPGRPAFPLGTDRFGRDILSRLIYGTRTAFLLALAAVPLAALAGTLVGLVAGYSGGRLDSALMLFSDTVQSLPGIMFMVIIVLIFRSLLEPTWLSGMITLVVGFAAIGWVSLARLVRVQVRRLKGELFVEAAMALGASPGYTIWRHLLPNVLHLVFIWMINNVPAVILLEAILGYIGVGVTGATDGGEFTVVSWGGMFFIGRSALYRNPWMLVVPSLSLLLLSMSFILLADFLNGISNRQQRSNEQG
jgi:ABC-type dipeptide/oligopeptide/nickel transport system permease subunit